MSSGAITSIVTFRSEVGMQSKGNDSGDAARISCATSSVSTCRTEYICTRLGLGGSGFTEMHASGVINKNLHILLVFIGEFINISYPNKKITCWQH